ncbi:hypothetical protein [Novosphingobium meiothermophilum]|uniref:hypothetical protein n=1 Tax=Novosphingobium meiothermophilum TaxID=2202251 RepID=UPI000D6E4D15|nr:hypothetical protein [Novosphingobium meiothermophilum]
MADPLIEAAQRLSSAAGHSARLLSQRDVLRKGDIAFPSAIFSAPGGKRYILSLTVEEVEELYDRKIAAAAAELLAAQEALRSAQ